MRCQLCGVVLSADRQCVQSMPESLYAPAHCTSCHWEARHAAEGAFCGPLLPAPYAPATEPAPREIPDPRDREGRWLGR